MTQLLYTMFIGNDRASFHFWAQEHLLKHQRVSKYCHNDCLKNVLSRFISLLTAKFVKNSHTRAKIYFIFLENVLKQTSNILNNQFQAR